MNLKDEPQKDEERQRKLDAAERVAAGMIHEFRNVLNPIVSAAWLLEANANDPAKVRELAKKIDGFARADRKVEAKMQELLDNEAAR